MLKHSVTIAWGERNYQNDNPLRTYRFKTEDELNAFLDGVSEGHGWHDYATIGDGFIFESEEEWRKDNDTDLTNNLEEDKKIPSA